MNAYSKLYLEDAMEILAEFSDFVVHGCKESLADIFRIFITTQIAKQFGEGNPKYVAGVSGRELAFELHDRSGKRLEQIEYHNTCERTPEYWCGWVLAYYQWHSGKSFDEILQKVSIAEILEMYPTLHEADIHRFVECMDRKIREKSKQSNLQRLRKNIGMSQAELAKKSGVSLRSIQMYEQKNKDINKAQIGSVVKLAQTLGCSPKDLMEL